MQKQIEKQDSDSPKYIEDLSKQVPLEVSTASNSQVYDNIQNQQFNTEFNNSESDMLENIENLGFEQKKINDKIQLKNQKNSQKNQESDSQLLEKNFLESQQELLINRKNQERIEKIKKEEESSGELNLHIQDDSQQKIIQQEQKNQCQLQMSSRFLKNYDCSMDLEQIEEEENENVQIAEPIFVNLNNDKFKQNDTPQLYFKCMEKYPKVIRYFIAGILGNIVLYLLDRFFLEFNPFDWQKETVAWTLSNIFHTPAQYILFEKLTFGEKENKIKGILGVYMSYSVGTIVGIIVNYILINQFSMNNDHAWLITLILTAFVNFVMVSYFMKNPYDHAIRETEIQQNQLQALQNANEVQDVQKSNSSQVENQQQQNLDIESGIVVQNLSKEQQKQKQFQFKYPFPSQVQRQQQKRLYYAKIWRTASTESDQ